MKRKNKRRKPVEGKQQRRSNACAMSRHDRPSLNAKDKNAWSERDRNVRGKNARSRSVKGKSVRSRSSRKESSD
jgi:hypothetical protein